MKKLTSATSLALGTILAFPGIAFALTIEKPYLFKYTDLGVLLGNIITLILIAAALVFFFMLVIGGIQWMVSGGDKAATESARGRITAALIGLVIVFSAWAIIKLMEQFLGIKGFFGGEIPIPEPK